MTANNLLMQNIADVLDVTVVRPWSRRPSASAPHTWQGWP